MRPYLTVSRLKKRCRNEIISYVLLLVGALLGYLCIGVVTSFVFWLILGSFVPAVFWLGFSIYGFQLATPHKIAIYRSIKQHYEEEIQALLAEQNNGERE